MTDKTTNLLLRATVDQGAAAQGVKALRDIQAASDGARESLLKINKDAARTSDEFKRLEEVSKVIGRDSAVDDLASQFADLGRATGDYEQQLINLRAALRDVGASGQEIRKATVAFRDLQNQAEAAGKSTKWIGNVEQLRRTGSSLNQLGLGVIGEPAQRAGDILQVAKELGILEAAVGAGPGGLAAAAVLTTAAVGGAALAVAGFNKIMDDSKRSVDNAIDTLDKFYEAIAKGTTTILKAQIEDAKGKKGGVDTELNQLKEQATKALLDSTNQGVLGFVGTALSGQQGALTDHIAKLQKESDALQNLIDGYTRALGSTNVATNDAAEAEKKLQDARAKAADNAISNAQQDTQLKATGTSEGIQNSVDEIEAARKKIGELLRGDFGLSIEKIDELNKQFVELGKQEENLKNNILPVVKAREAEEQAIKDAEKALDASKKAFDDWQNSVKKLNDVNREITKLEGDRAAQVKRQAEDDARNAERSATEKDYAARIAVAKREEAEQTVREKAAADNATAEVKRQDSLSKIDRDYFATELKAYQNYIDAEKRQTDRANLERLRTLEDAQTDLRALAARGDVAGFVERSNQAKTQLARQAQDADLEAQQRRADYEKGLQDARDARQRQIDDLNASFEQERAAREAAAQQRIQEIEAQGQEQNSKSAQLEQELNDIREEWRRDDLKRQRDLEEENYNERLQLQRDKQAEILQETANFFNEWVNSITSTANSAVNVIGNILNVLGGGTPSHAAGKEYVPHDNYLARLDEGERVLTRTENQDYTFNGGRRGGGGDTYNVTVEAIVGDVAAKSYVDSLQTETVKGIKQSLRKSRGRGPS